MQHKNNLSFKEISRETKLVLTILICIASLTALLPFSQLALGQTSTSTVSGSVTDSAGANLSNATVELRTTGGALITSTSTSASGSYSFANVAYGSYNLQVSKQGYAKATQTIMVNMAEQSLGTTALSGALSLSAATLGFAANPGDRLQIPFTATYSGEGRETVDLLVTAPSGWSTRVMQSSYEVNRVSLQSAQSASLQLEVNVPAGTTRGIVYNVSLTVSGSTRAFLNFTVLLSNQTTGSVSGKFVDEKTLGLSGVTVDVLASGVSIANAQSNSDGTFTLNVPAPGSYVLQFSKAGFVQSTRPLSLTASNPSSALGNVELTRTLWLTSTIISINVNPGDRLVLPFMASNMGTDLEPVTFASSAPSGWKAKVLDSGGFKIESISLSPSAGSSFQLEVIVPLGTNGIFNVGVSATGNITTTLNFTVKVGPPTDSLLSCSYPGKSSTPGDSLKFQMKLKNPFSAAVRFNVSVLDLPPNWTAMVKSAAGDFVNEILLGPNEVAELVVEAKSPSFGATGVLYPFKVRAEALGQNLAETLPLTAMLTELANEITMQARLPEIAVEAGRLVDYNIVVSNLGADDRNLVLTTSPPPNWKVLFKLGAVEITRLYLYGGNTSDLLVQVIPPNNVALGTYITPVKVKSESGTLLAEVNLTTTVRGSYGLEVTPSVFSLNANSGESATFQATVTNTGYSPITNLSVNVTCQEDNWVLNVNPIVIDRLEAHQSRTVDVTVKTSETTVTGDYIITVRSKSDQLNADGGTVRLIVSASTAWGLYGVGIAVVFIVILILVFRKFRRR
jgi:uncharacterized membrane protein